MEAHKKRVLIVAGVVGALMSVLIAGCLIIQGVEDRALEQMTRATEREYTGEVEGAPVALASMCTVAGWLGIEMYAPGMRTEGRVKLAERIREEAIGKVVETENGERYYVADFLPGGAFDSTLKVSRGTEYNPLDLVLTQVNTSSVPMFAIPGELEEAIEPAILEVQENFRGVWKVHGVICVILMIIVVVIELSTYVRLIGQDTKTIALYYAMGATQGQIRVVYGIYLSMLSMVAVLVAMAVGAILAMVVSLVNAGDLAQAFMLAFGAEVEQVWLVGWNARIWGMVVVLLLIAPVAILLSGRQFASKKLAQRLK